MNDLSNLNGTMGVTRTADMVAMEIKMLEVQYNAVTLCYAVEVGRKLKEAHELVQYGEWENWLEANINYSKSKAESLINLFEAYGSEQIGFFGQLKAQTFGDLTVTKALALLKVPEDEREDFIEDNDVGGLSTRQLQKLIKEKQEAEDLKAQAVRDMEEAQGREKKAQDAQAAAEKATKKAADDLAAEKKKAAHAEAEAKRLNEEMKALRAKPVETPEDEDAGDDDSEAESIRQEAKEAAERELQAKIDVAEKQAKDAEARAAELQKQLMVADPAVAKFSALYVEVQGLLTKLVGLIGEAAPEKQAGLRKALEAALEKCAEQLQP